MISGAWGLVLKIKSVGVSRPGSFVWCCIFAAPWSAATRAKGKVPKNCGWLWYACSSRGPSQLEILSLSVSQAFLFADGRV